MEIDGLTVLEVLGQSVILDTSDYTGYEVIEWLFKNRDKLDLSAEFCNQDGKLGVRLNHNLTYQGFKVREFSISSRKELINIGLVAEKMNDFLRLAQEELLFVRDNRTYTLRSIEINCNRAVLDFVLV